MLTGPAQHFWERSQTYAPAAWEAFQALAGAVPVLRDADEWAAWDALGDGVVHIELREWADLLLVAPLSANTLAKLAQGLCDNLLVRSRRGALGRWVSIDITRTERHTPRTQTSVVRAWDARKPVVVAPAMNTHMWEHPFTARHLRVLSEELGYTVVDPVAKLLACGDRGQCMLVYACDFARWVLT